MGVEFLTASIADRAYDRIRTDIIFGRLVPGAKLRLYRLARDYGASVSTLREIEPPLVGKPRRRGRAAWVSRQSGIARRLREVAAMRLLLETYAIAPSFAAGDLEWESRVVAAHHKLAFMERRMLAGEQDGTELWKGYDRAFHQTLIEACGSQTLLDLYGGVYDQYLRYQMVAVVFRGPIAAEEHRLLLDSALARDSERACEFWPGM